MKTDFRVEVDSMGEMRVPQDAYYGAQTARAVENFPISNLRFPRQFIRALGLIKKHAAHTNHALGLLPTNISEATQKAAQEVMDGKWDGQFMVDIFQTGSGTSTNMNANEVIANRAAEINGGKRGDKSVHPNDHVNRGQSSNDVIPTAIHIAALDGIVQGLIPALNELHAALAGKAGEFDAILKIGRTHLRTPRPSGSGRSSAAMPARLSGASRDCTQLRGGWASFRWAAPRSGRASTHTWILRAGPSKASAPRRN